MGNTISSASSAAAQQRQAEMQRQVEMQRQAEQALQAAQQALQALQAAQAPAPSQSSTSQVGAQSPVAQEYHRDAYDTRAGVSQPLQTQGSTEPGSHVGQGDIDPSLQTTEKGCGPTSLVQLTLAASNNKKSAAEATHDVAEGIGKANSSKAIQDKGVKVDLTNGTTPSEMAVLLGEQGQRVTRGFDNFDAQALQGALGQGQNALALVDSNAIKPGGENAPPGPLHWVTIDHIDQKGTPGTLDQSRVEVSDPATGTKYTVSEEQFKAATEKARQQRGTGGVLLVQPDSSATTDAQREQLALDNLNHSALLGDDNGGQGGRNNNLSGGFYG